MTRDDAFLFLRRGILVKCALREREDVIVGLALWRVKAVKLQSSTVDTKFTKNSDDVAGLIGPTALISTGDIICQALAVTGAATQAILTFASGVFELAGAGSLGPTRVCAGRQKTG